MKESLISIYLRVKKIPFKVRWYHGQSSYDLEIYRVVTLTPTLDSSLQFRFLVRGSIYENYFGQVDHVGWAQSKNYQLLHHKKQKIKLP